MFNKIILFILVVFTVRCSEGKVKNYTCFDDAASDNIGVLMGSVLDDFIAKEYPNAKIVRIEMATDLISALRAGSCDVAVIPDVCATELIKTDSNLAVLQDNIYATSLGMGFNKKNATLRDEFNLFLAEIKRDGLYDEIVARWTDGFEGAEMPEIVLPKTGKPIRVGTTSMSIPFSVEANGKSSGLDIELITRFAAHVKRPIELHRMNFGALLPALSSGNVDVVASGIIISPKRAKEIDFSDPYYQCASVAIVMKKDVAPPVGYRSINEMAQKRIGVILGSTQDTYVTEKFPNSTVIRVDVAADLMLALKSDKCDVFAIAESIVNTTFKDDPDVCILDSTLYKGGTALGFNLGDTALRDEFNKMLAEFRTDGTYDQMYERWINQSHPVMPKLDMPKTGTPLRVAVASVGAPYDYYENGENVGFDCELARRFGQRLGRPVQFQIINFGGIIAAVTSGKVDIIAAGLSVTDERAKNVAFADAHSIDNIVSVVLRKNLAATEKSTNNKYATKEDVSKKRIAVLMGSTHDDFVVEHFPESHVIRCDTHTDILMALIGGKCDAAVLNATTYTSMQRANPQIAQLDSMLSREDIGVGFSYQQKELRDQFNAFLKDTRESKLYDEIYTRWINNGNSARMPKIEMPRSGKPIRVGVTGSLIPFTFISDGEHAGFDIELLLRFAKSINRPIEFTVINFGGLISALSSGKVDVVSAAMAITKERAKQVNFSDPYFYNGLVLAVLGRNLAGSDVSTTQNVEKKGFFESVSDSFYNNLIAEKRYMLILKGLSQTLIISVFAALLGTIIGAVVCFMRMSKKVMLNSFARGYLTIMRGIPVLVLLMLLFYVVFAKWDVSATIVAILTFALNFGAYVSEMFRTSIQGVDRGQTEAGIALGFTKIQTFIFVVMPQAVKSVLPVYKGELISLIKMTSVVGYIAVEDLTKASDIIRSRTFDAFFPLIMVAVIYFILAWGFTAILDSISKKMTTR